MLDWRLRRAEFVLAFRRIGGPLFVVTPPAGELWADPFLLEHDRRRFLFFERLVHAHGRGEIASVEIDESGLCSDPVQVLATSTHLSYPFVFAWEGEVYMLPSIRGKGPLELYRADELPARWSRDRVLFSEGHLDDATLLHHSDRWWLFGSTADRDLHLFSADSLGPDWVPHPGDPVLCDPGSARPAGRIIERDGVLVRPGQDCRLRYGRAVVLSRIEELTPETYREVEVARIAPDWLPGLAGTHAYDTDGVFEAFDAYRLVVRGTRVGGREPRVAVVEPECEPVRPSPAETVGVSR